MSCGGRHIFCYLQGQGHSKGSYDQNMTLSAILSELLIPWQPNLVDGASSLASVLWENGVTAFKVKVTETFQNVREYLSGQYALNHKTYLR